MDKAAEWNVTAKSDREEVKAQVRRLFAPLTDEQFDAIPFSSAYGAWLTKKGRRPSDWSKSRINNLGGGRPEDYDYYDPDDDISVVVRDALRWKLASVTFDSDKDLCWSGKRITILAENKDAGASIVWTGLVDRDFSQGWMSLSDMTYHERKKLCENYTIGSTAFDSLGDLRRLLDAGVILNILDYLITGTTEDDFNNSCPHQEVEAIYDWLVQEYGGDDICFAERNADIIKSIKEAETKRETAAVRAKKLQMLMPLDKAMHALSDAEEWTVSQAVFWTPTNIIEINAKNMRVGVDLKWTYKIPLHCVIPHAVCGEDLWTEILHSLKGRRNDCKIETPTMRWSPGGKDGAEPELLSVADFVLDNIIEKEIIAPFLLDCDLLGPVTEMCDY
ncbi:hypothetical protein [Gluconacetobacter dulcium]|uniref:hypothetical protein n=1 Tax=Gluconacetobacter dulcium TaxID=2729096 RepID=UPI001C7EF9BE|nr:hypothetical protein [Gluconacetobacter dulcium]